MTLETRSLIEDAPPASVDTDALSSTPLSTSLVEPPPPPPRPQQQPSPPVGRRMMLRALAHRNFRLFWAGAFLSNIGKWMQTMAQGWLVLDITDSAFWLGADAFMATAPGFLLTLLGGVFADSIDRKKLLLWTQIVAGLAALVLGVLIAFDLVEVWMILVLSFITGCTIALSSPAYQAFTSDLVERDELPNAIALNSTQFQLSRVIGPILAALAIKAFGFAGCFIGNAASSIFIVVALWQVRLVSDGGNDDNNKQTAHADAAHTAGAVWQDLVAGLRYVQKRPRVRMLLLISSVVSLFGAPYGNLIPVFARDIHGMDETGLATMLGTGGAGALCGALMLVLLGDVRHKGWFVISGASLFGMCLIGFALATDLVFALVMLFAVSFALVASVAVTNMLLQQMVTDEMRGRVMSMFMFSFLGVIPFGNLIAGIAAERYGAPLTIAFGGLVTAVFVTVVGLRDKRLRDS